MSGGGRPRGFTGRTWAGCWGRRVGLSWPGGSPGQEALDLVSGWGKWEEAGTPPKCLHGVTQRT